jgi:hypothetical protein
MVLGSGNEANGLPIAQRWRFLSRRQATAEREQQVATRRERLRPSPGEMPSSCSFGLWTHNPFKAVSTELVTQQPRPGQPQDRAAILLSFETKRFESMLIENAFYVSNR